MLRTMSFVAYVNVKFLYNYFFDVKFFVRHVD